MPSTSYFEDKTSQEEKSLSLLAENDEVAAYLVRSMWHKRYNTNWNLNEIVTTVVSILRNIFWGVEK